MLIDAHWIRWMAHVYRNICRFIHLVRWAAKQLTISNDLFFLLFWFQHIPNSTQFTRTCDESDFLCKCSDYMTFTEPPYEENVTDKMWCGKSFEYKSRGRVLVINYVFDTSHSNPFNLSYVTESEWTRLSTIIQPFRLFFDKSLSLQKINSHTKVLYPQIKHSKRTSFSRHFFPIFIRAI